MWHAQVKAPQGGPVYVHEVEDSDPADVFRYLADALDLTRADKVTVEMWPIPD